VYLFTRVCRPKALRVGFEFVLSLPNGTSISWPRVTMTYAGVWWRR
jgi:hypothetical protein